MGLGGSSYSMFTEEELLELLTHALSGSSVDHKRKRINGLEELQRRIRSNSIRNVDGSVDVLLEMARKQGNNRPESSLVVDSILLFFDKYAEAFQRVLKGLEGKEEEEGRLFLVFSKVALRLKYKRKKQAIGPQIRFLVSRDALNSIGAKEVYERLLSLGKEKLSQEIVEQASPYLHSLEICAVVFSVRLCSRFAEHELLPKMLEILDKSMKGYFSEHHTEIERDICQYISRVNGLQSLPVLMSLLKMRSEGQTSHINKAIARVLDVNPHRVDNVLETLYDERRNGDVINAILQCFLEMETTKINATKLLSNIDVDWWYRYPNVRTSLHRLFVKVGESAKPTLFKILQEEEKYDFALRCLKEIGISKEEISAIFRKSVMLQIYNFFYKGSRRFPKNLDNLWEEKGKLGKEVPGKITRLDYFLLHLFSAFNLATLTADPSQRAKGCDIVCFHPDTLNLFIIGCTTGILKNDLANMDALTKKMKIELPDLYGKCTVTPVVVCTEIASISSSDAQYASQNGIVILKTDHIDKLLEMLNTNRKSTDVVEYIKSCRLPPSVPRP